MLLIIKINIQLSITRVVAVTGNDLLLMNIYDYLIIFAIEVGWL